MKQVYKLPTEGQFSAVWIHNNNVMSGSFKWIDGKLFEYAEYAPNDDGEPEYEDDFVNQVVEPFYFTSKNTVYFTQ